MVTKLATSRFFLHQRMSRSAFPAGASQNYIARPANAPGPLQIRVKFDTDGPVLWPSPLGKWFPGPDLAWD